MKIRKIAILIALAILIGGSMIGCTSQTSAVDPDNNSQNVDNGDDCQLSDYETIGEIIKFEENKVHILTGDIASTYEIDEENLKEFYLGETAGVIKDSEGKCQLKKYKIEDFSVKHTTMGELILQATGKIKSVNKDRLIITTEEGDIEVEFSEDALLAVGTEISVEYLERDGKNILIQYYYENSKMDMTVKKISRSENTGVMVLDTEDVDGMKYVVYVLENTDLNFNHSDLKVDDKITVYAEEIRESYPAQADAKRILK